VSAPHAREGIHVKVFAYAIRDIEAHAQEYIRFYWEN